jgi:hypothetical protein
MMKIGEVWSHDAYYLDGDEFKKKYLLALAVMPDGDIVYRLTTSRQLSRPTHPPCYHGDPYPGFYLGVLGNGLDKESWLDLRECEDMDSYEFAKLYREGAIGRVTSLHTELFISALDCAANAQDTTKRQRNAMLASKDALTRR